MSIFGSAELMLKTINPSWLDILKTEINSPYFKQLLQFLANEQKSNIICPPSEMVDTYFQSNFLKNFLSRYFHGLI